VAYERVTYATAIIGQLGADGLQVVSYGTLLVAESGTAAIQRVTHAAVLVAYYEDPSAPSFPTQYDGLLYESSANVWTSLCLVAEADAATGMGGAPLFERGGSWYAAYLVDSTDPDASPILVETSLGWKHIRLKT
jgi:hypothetical protein